MPLKVAKSRNVMCGRSMTPPLALVALCIAPDAHSSRKAFGMAVPQGTLTTRCAVPDANTPTHANCVSPQGKPRATLMSRSLGPIVERVAVPFELLFDGGFVVAAGARGPSVRTAVF